MTATARPTMAALREVAQPPAQLGPILAVLVIQIQGILDCGDGELMLYGSE